MQGRSRATATLTALVLLTAIGGLTGCAGSAPAVPAAVPEVVEAAPTPTPTPMVVPYEDTFDPGQYGTGDPEADMGLISGEFVAGIQAVRDYAPGAYPDVYTGVGGGVPGNPDVLRIILTTLDPAVEADLLAVSGLPSDKVRFEQGVLSEKAGQALQSRIMADLQSGALASIDIGAFGAGVDGVVEIQLTGHDPAQIAQLSERYGADIRIVVDAPVLTATAADASA